MRIINCSEYPGYEEVQSTHGQIGGYWNGRILMLCTFCSLNWQWLFVRRPCFRLPHNPWCTINETYINTGTFTDENKNKDQKQQQKKTLYYNQRLSNIKCDVVVLYLVR